MNAPSSTATIARSRQSQPRALAHGRELHDAERHGDGEDQAGEQRTEERPAIEPELLSDARQERGADEHRAMVHVRLVALERVDLAADEEQRAEHQQDADGPSCEAARTGGDREQRRPEDEPDEHAPEIEEEVPALEGEEARMALREIDRDDADRGREQARAPGPPAHPRRRPGREPAARRATIWGCDLAGVGRRGS
jgi:hypothetical protein